MAQRCTPTGLSGILALDKPSGMTSHDVVDAVRRVTGERRVGHAGTLDPMATGLLLVCVGPATRLSDYLMSSVKTYEARICFGRATNTDDAEGETVRSAAVPLAICDTEYAAQTLSELTGTLLQIPPAFSAIKKEGVVAYKAARKGEAIELDPRQVQLYEARLRAVGPDYWDVEFVVSKGFYVRSFARDVGANLGSAAHLGALRRTASGAVSIAQARRVDELVAASSDTKSSPATRLPRRVDELVAANSDTKSSSATRLARRVDEVVAANPLPYIDPAKALGLPVVEVSAEEKKWVQNGRALTLDTAAAREHVLVGIVYEKKLLALYERSGSSCFFHPKVVIPGGVDSPRA